MRPSTASGNAQHRRAVADASSAAAAVTAVQQQPLQGKLRPHSASHGALVRGKAQVGVSSDDLIRDLEAKVRKVVEQKRAESDKLRFNVGKKREDVARAKALLQDLIKDSEALGLHYQEESATDDCNQQEDGDNQTPDLKLTEDPKILEERGRLQPIASISRRPVYSKHTNISELETKLEKRVKEMHHVHRRTLVLEHIKKRLLNERIEEEQSTNQLKLEFADLSQRTQELHKKEITAAEAVSQVQTRLAQQKEDMAVTDRKFKREILLRQKWAREKAKFEKYYNDQIQSVEARQNQQSQPAVAKATFKAIQTLAGATLGDRRPSNGSVSPTLRCRKSVAPVAELAASEEELQVYRDAFQSIGFGLHGEPIDPEEIVGICMSYQELKQELDTKYREELERTTELRQLITRAQSIDRESIQLSKRGTSQKLETKEIELSAIERSLATVVDQYMFVDQSVRPLKIGLQQIVQNLTGEAIHIDDLDSMESSLIESCEEMMRLLRQSREESALSQDEETNSFNQDHTAQADESGDDSGSPVSKAAPSRPATATDVFSVENFTSPFNVRIPPKQREPYYFVAGINTEPVVLKGDDEDVDETDFEVMDRATAKRISSVLICTSTGKKAGKDKAAKRVADKQHAVSRDSKS